MYKIKNTERNSEKASEFETFSMLYLLGIRKDRDLIDLVLVDCFNDVTGSNEQVSHLWDVQSKGHKSNTPLQIGEHLVTLFENYISDFPFKHLILFLETVSDRHVADSTQSVFGTNNFTSEARSNILNGLVREYARRTSIEVDQVPIDKVNSFLDFVDFVICSRDKVANVKNLIEFKNKEVRKDDFYVEIFNEIRDMQSRLKNTNVENIELHQPNEVLAFKKHITRTQILTLLVNRFVGIELFSARGIPTDFIPYITPLEREDVRDTTQNCVSAICRTFFDKNNKKNIWQLLESIMTRVMMNPDLGIEDVLVDISPETLSNVPTLDRLSLLFLIARIKDGLE